MFNSLFFNTLLIITEFGPHACINTEIDMDVFFFPWKFLVLLHLYSQQVIFFLLLIIPYKTWFSTISSSKGKLKQADLKQAARKGDIRFVGFFFSFFSLFFKKAFASLQRGQGVKDKKHAYGSQICFTIWKERWTREKGTYFSCSAVFFNFFSTELKYISHLQKIWQHTMSFNTYIQYLNKIPYRILGMKESIVYICIIKKPHISSIWNQNILNIVVVFNLEV